MKRLALFSLIALSGCQWIGNTADSLGSHLPTIGDRCESWQCFTASGQSQSDAVKAQRAREQQPDSQKQDPVPPIPAQPQQ